MTEPLTATEFDALLRLLDDETPVVRERVAARLAIVGGDLSHFFSQHPRALSPQEADILTDLLRPAKRAALAAAWETATADIGKDGPPGWDEVERLLGCLSAFLHDGITPRPALGAALDTLAASAREAGATEEMTLRTHLFQTLGFKGADEGYQDPRNADLAWSIANRTSNPIGLCLIYILVGRRLRLVVDGVAFPGHFLCRIHPQGVPVIVDCFNEGQIHVQDILLEPESDLTRQQRNLLRKTATPITTLVRVLNNLAAALQQREMEAEYQLVQQLRRRLED